MPQGNEMAGTQPRAVGVVHAHACQPGITRKGLHKRDKRSTLEQGGQDTLLTRLARRDEQDSVNISRFHGPDLLRHHFRVILRQRQERGAFLLVGDRLDPLQDGRKKRRDDIGQQDAPQARATTGESARQLIRLVAHALAERHHTLAGRLVDAAASRKHQRDSGGIDIQRVRDLRKSAVTLPAPVPEPAGSPSRVSVFLASGFILTVRSRAGQ